MSFQNLRVAELRKIAEDFGVDIENAVGKNAILAALDEEGVTYESYAALQQAEPVEPEEIGHMSKPAVKKFEDFKNGVKDTVLVKMERNNPSYDANGYVFTRDHPFIAMTEDEAQTIFDLETGFRLATPSEVKEYYS
jgi:cupin superfamily acireductone dioxygenase involved in methionine salvage